MDSISDVLVPPSSALLASEGQGLWSTPQDHYIPLACPGMKIMSGALDPRAIDITSADVAGLGPHGFETSDAMIFRTGEKNMHSVNWLMATTSEGDSWKEIHMVMVQLTSQNNEIVACVAAAGDYDMLAIGHELNQLDEQSVKFAWAARENAVMSECDTCPGYGVRNIVADYTAINYEGSVNEFQSLGFITQTCPGDVYGYTSDFANVTTDLIDGYAGLAYLGGSDVRNSSVHEGVVFHNRKVDNSTESFIVGFVDFQDWQMKMVEIQLKETDGSVHLCAPTAKTYNSAPDEVNKTNIRDFWRDSSSINVASCVNCAGYGVTNFKFETIEPLAPTPEPTTAPQSVPTYLPTLEPTLTPTTGPSALPEDFHVIPDGAGSLEDVEAGLVDGVPDGQDTIVRDPVPEPTREPITEPSFAPIPGPTVQPVSRPTYEPTVLRIETTFRPTLPSDPTTEPVAKPTEEPSKGPVAPPTFYPIGSPTMEPVSEPTPLPTVEPTKKSDVILGRPCEKTDDYIDEGGLTVDGVPIDANSADKDIGTSEYLTMDPSAEPSLAPTFGPTELVGEPSLQPSIKPSFEPTAEPSLEPTFGPTELVGKPSLQPTFQPTDEPTYEPTAQQTFGDTLEPCVYDGEIYAPANLASHFAQLNSKSLKSCSHPGFKNKMQLVAKPSKPLGATAPAKSANKHVKAHTKSVEDMPDSERRAFFLAHFATPEQKARAAKAAKE